MLWQLLINRRCSRRTWPRPRTATARDRHAVPQRRSRRPRRARARPVRDRHSDLGLRRRSNHRQPGSAWSRAHLTPVVFGYARRSGYLKTFSTFALAGGQQRPARRSLLSRPVTVPQKAVAPTLPASRTGRRAQNRRRAPARRRPASYGSSPACSSSSAARPSAPRQSALLDQRQQLEIGIHRDDDRAYYHTHSDHQGSGYY